MKDNVMNKIYDELIDDIQAKRSEVDSNGSCLYFLLLIVDNFHLFNVSSESRMAKVNTETINSLTILHMFHLKNAELLQITRDENRAPLMPKLNDSNLLNITVSKSLCKKW
jgi:hypothetical protein